jgi:hypothetical protein
MVGEDQRWGCAWVQTAKEERIVGCGGWGHVRGSVGWVVWGDVVMWGEGGLHSGAPHADAPWGCDFGQHSDAPQIGAHPSIIEFED